MIGHTQATNSSHCLYIYVVSLGSGLYMAVMSTMYMCIKCRVCLSNVKNNIPIMVTIGDKCYPSQLHSINSYSHAIHTIYQEDY